MLNIDAIRRVAARLGTSNADHEWLAERVPALVAEAEWLRAIVVAVDAALAPQAGDDAQREAWKNYADRGVGIVLESFR